MVVALDTCCYTPSCSDKSGLKCRTCHKFFCTDCLLYYTSNSEPYEMFYITDSEIFICIFCFINIQYELD